MDQNFYNIEQALSKELPTQENDFTCKSPKISETISYDWLVDLINSPLKK